MKTYMRAHLEGTRAEVARYLGLPVYMYRWSEKRLREYITRCWPSTTVVFRRMK